MTARHGRLPLAVDAVVVVAILGTAPAAADTVLYGADNVHQRLYRIDPASGAATLLGPLRYENVRGLAIDAEGVLYGVDTVTDTLLRIDPASGEARELCTLVPDRDFDPFVASVAFDPTSGALLGIDYAVGALYRIDVASGRMTRLLDLDHDLGHGGALAFRPGGTLFVFDPDRDLLQRLDPLTGSLDPIGRDARAGHVTAIAFDPDGRTLYALDTGTLRLLVLDPASGRVRGLPPHGVAFISGLAAGRR